MVCYDILGGKFRSRRPELKCLHMHYICQLTTFLLGFEFLPRCSVADVDQSRLKMPTSALIVDIPLNQLLKLFHQHRLVTKL